ncbi:MAG: DUF1570 domain-containing protein [Planctomycetaceae bacterium]|nr:DUF1570 domain-containing protein [Planctomycetaceae bacterium]
MNRLQMEWRRQMSWGRLGRLCHGLILMTAVLGTTLVYSQELPQKSPAGSDSSLGNAGAGLVDAVDDKDLAANISLPSWDRLTIKVGEEAARQVEGKVEVEALDGSVLFQDMLGHLLLLRKNEVLDRLRHDSPVELTAEALEGRLKHELPEGFRLHQTRHYTFCYWTDREYVQWVATLYERLFSGFNNFWKNRGFEPRPATRPLIVLVFANRAQFERFARTDMKAEPTGIIGYYHVLNNWVVMYDLMADGQFGGRERGLSQALSHPNAVPMVATIVHEATHQLMFNNGMQQRLADIPLWVSEGLAVYFEAPDLTSKQGWKGIGKINVLRYQRAKQYLQQRPADSLVTLMQDDKRFRDGTATLDAYAEAWALNFFLLKKYAKQYQAYLQALSEKAPLINQTGPERIALFEEKLGKPLSELDREFVQFLQKLQ